jgi:hypothetical protein
MESCDIPHSATFPAYTQLMANCRSAGPRCLRYTVSVSTAASRAASRCPALPTAAPETLWALGCVQVTVNLAVASHHAVLCCAAPRAVTEAGMELVQMLARAHPTALVYT